MFVNRISYIINMKELPKNVRQEIMKFVPSSLIADIACFVFYDNHPSDDKTIDITICTKHGELKEYYQRDLVSTLDLNFKSKPTDIKILRNENSKLFYVVAADEELYIISGTEQLQIHKKLSNIERYDINDTDCSGRSSLKVVRKDDAVSLLFDNNFEPLDDRSIISNLHNDEDSLPILTELKRKLVEAKYNTKCNEKTYLEYLNLRQRVTLQSYQNMHPNSNDSSAFKDDSKRVSGALKLKTIKPWIKVCNKKIIIILDVLNECKEPLENVHILLNTSLPSLVYTTKVFTRQPTSPYWEQTETHKLRTNQEYAVIALMDLEEIKLHVTSRIEMTGCISYEMCGKEYLLPFEDVAISSSDSMGDEFDVLSDAKPCNHNTLLAILASTVRTELVLRHIKNDDEPNLSILNLCCTHLQMETLGDNDHVIVYRKSPYHVLNGIMIVFHSSSSQPTVPVSLYTRSPSQILALIHYINDAVPAKIIVTTPNFKIHSKTDELSHYNEDIIETPKQINIMDYATSILNRSTRILEHLDNSMIKMSESKNPEVHNKVGSHIDLFAGGVEDFKKLRLNILEDTRKGISSLVKLNVDSTEINRDSDVMIVD